MLRGSHRKDHNGYGEWWGGDLSHAKRAIAVVQHLDFPVAVLHTRIPFYILSGLHIPGHGTISQCRIAAWMRGEWVMEWGRSNRDDPGGRNRAAWAITSKWNESPEIPENGGTNKVSETKSLRQIKQRRTNIRSDIMDITSFAITYLLRCLEAHLPNAPGM